MNFSELEKKAFEKEIKNLIETRDGFTNTDDCYCALMKQIFLSKSTLN